MLGRKTYEAGELAAARNAIEGQVAAYRALVASVPAKAAAEREAFEQQLAIALVLELDRFFVHRVRPVSGKDTNPLTEVELIVESVLAGTGTFATNKVIRWVPAAAVVGFEDGDALVLSLDQAEQLATAFLAEIQARCVDVG